MNLYRLTCEILAEKGLSDSVEVQSSGSRQANLFLLDPTVVDQVGQVLRQNRIASRRVGADSLEIFASDPTEEGDDEKQVRKLVSQWRGIIKNSSSGFRKASHNLVLKAKDSQKLDPIKAAEMLASLTLKLAKKQGVQPLMGLSRLLRKTVKSNDVKLAKFLLNRLSGSSQDPTRPVIKTADNGKSKKAPPGQLVTEAENYIRDYAHTSTLSPEDIQVLANELGDAFESWIGSLSFSADVDDAIHAWSLAASNVSAEQGLETSEPPQPEGDVNWAQDTLAPVMASSLDSHTESRRRRILRLVELCIEQYASEMNPKEITSERVEEFLGDKGVSDDEIEKVYRVLNKILHKKETEQNTEASSIQSNIPPVAMMSQDVYKNSEAKPLVGNQNEGE